MTSRKILFMSADAKSRNVLPPALLAHTPEFDIESFGRVTDALTALAGSHFDAAVCCVDQPDELAYVIRLKKRKPELPVVLLTRVAEAGFESLAESMGATVVVRKTGGLDATVGTLALALRARTLAEQATAQTRRTAELSRDLRKLARHNRKLIGDALGLAAANSQRHFLTLLVEDDPDQALILIRALARAKLPPFLHTVTSVEEAMDYLAGNGKYADREAYPFPSLVITDLNLPGKSGLDLIAWMRERTETRQVGVIMLTSSDDDRDIDEAYVRGANLYLIKRLDMQEIVDVVRQVYSKFTGRTDAGDP